MKYEEIISSLKKKEFQPIYLLMGEEGYFIDKIADFISHHVLNESEKDFNQHILYGKDTTPETIISYARRFPMMAEHQVIIIREAQNIKKLEDLIPYAEHPLESTILVICHKYKTVDKRKTFVRLVKEKGVVFESQKIYENQLPDWINHYLRVHDYSIETQASILLSQYLGTDLSKVSNELDKLIIGYPPKTRITPDHVEKNIGISKNFNIFELQNAIGERDLLKTNRIIFHFAANQGANPFPKTITGLYFFFMKLLTYHFMKSKSPGEVAGKLQIHPFFVKSYISAAQKYTIKKIVEIMAILREYDMKSKGSGNNSGTTEDLQKEMIYKILH